MDRQFRKFSGSLATGLLAMALFGGCLAVDTPFSGLPPGPWRGILELDARPITSNPQAKPLPGSEGLAFEEVTAGELPFNFEVIYENEQDFYIEIANGSERIRVDDIFIGRDRSTAKDTVVITFPLYDSYIRAIFEEDVMEGEWVLNNNPPQRIPFVARHGQAHRFTTLRKPPAADISGRWQAVFGIGGQESYPALAEFRQEGNQLEGTFVTEAGGFGYLEGSVQANKFYLSGFDGARAFLFEGKIQEDSSLIGSFRSGEGDQLLWQASRNSEFQLPSPLPLPAVREGFEGRVFSFEAGGRRISMDSALYRNKVVIVQLMGSWSPNCRAQAEFLTQYLKQKGKREIEILALAFERHKEVDKAKKAVQAFKEKMALPYEVLYAGSADEESTSRALPMLDGIRAYPSVLFIGRDGRIRQVQSGFAGPESSAYAAFEQEFENHINQLLNENQ